MSICDRRFPRSARLLRSVDFARVFETHYKTADEYFTVLGRSALVPGSPARVGLAVSRKCARRAVDRNRIKRLIRETFRSARASLWEVDLVVMCRPASLNLDNALLRESLTRHWRRQKERLCAKSPA